MQPVHIPDRDFYTRVSTGLKHTTFTSAKGG